MSGGAALTKEVGMGPDDGLGIMVGGLMLVVAMGRIGTDVVDPTDTFTVLIPVVASRFCMVGA